MAELAINIGIYRIASNGITFIRHGWDEIVPSLTDTYVEIVPTQSSIWTEIVPDDTNIWTEIIPP